MTTVENPSQTYNPAIVRFVQNWRRAAGEFDTAPRPTDRWPESPDPAAVPTPAPRHPSPDETRDLATAADRALRVYPGPVGELVDREIRAYLAFGHRFGHDTVLIDRLAKDVLAVEPAPEGEGR